MERMSTTEKDILKLRQILVSLTTESLNQGQSERQAEDSSPTELMEQLVAFFKERLLDIPCPPGITQSWRNQSNNAPVAPANRTEAGGSASNNVVTQEAAGMPARDPVVNTANKRKSTEKDVGQEGTTKRARSMKSPVLKHGCNSRRIVHSLEDIDSPPPFGAWGANVLNSTLRPDVPPPGGTLIGGNAYIPNPGRLQRLEIIRQKINDWNPNYSKSADANVSQVCMERKARMQKYLLKSIEDKPSISTEQIAGAIKDAVATVFQDRKDKRKILHYMRRGLEKNIVQAFNSCLEEE